MKVTECYKGLFVFHYFKLWGPRLPGPDAGGGSLLAVWQCQQPGGSHNALPLGPFSYLYCLFFVTLFPMFNRPGVARAVLQTAS